MPQSHPECESNLYSFGLWNVCWKAVFIIIHNFPKNPELDLDVGSIILENLIDLTNEFGFSLLTESKKSSRIIFWNEYASVIAVGESSSFISFVFWS